MVHYPDVSWIYTPFLNRHVMLLSKLFYNLPFSPTALIWTIFEAFSVTSGRCLQLAEPRPSLSLSVPVCPPLSLSVPPSHGHTLGTTKRRGRLRAEALPAGEPSKDRCTQTAQFKRHSLFYVAVPFELTCLFFLSAFFFLNKGLR